MKLLCAAVFGVVTMFALTGSAKADDTAKLLGKWEVTKTDSETPKGTIVEFMKDGKMKATVKNDGNELKLAGTYKLDGKKLNVKLKLDSDTIEHDYTIKLVGTDGLELVDADKKVVTLKKMKK